MSYNDKNIFAKILNGEAECVKVLENDLQSGKRVVIHTDSEYSMKCCCEYGRRSESRNWKGSDGRVIANLDLVKVDWCVLVFVFTQVEPVDIPKKSTILVALLLGALDLLGVTPLSR